MHTEECNASLIARNILIHDWIHKWPNHCKDCYGAGGKTYWETLGDPEHGQCAMEEPCQCMERGICPRCGEHGLTGLNEETDDIGEGPCTFCNWDYWDCYDKYPPPYECCCIKSWPEEDW